MRLLFHDNKKGGREQLVPVADLVRAFRESKHNDERYRFDRAFSTFLGEYEIDGLRSYDPLTVDQISAIWDEYCQQEES